MLPRSITLTQYVFLLPFFKVENLPKKLEAVEDHIFEINPISASTIFVSLSGSKDIGDNYSRPTKCLKKSAQSQGSNPERYNIRHVNKWNPVKELDT